MLQGDPGWNALTAAIAEEDHAGVVAHNAHPKTSAETAIRVSHGPAPFLGAIMTAPVVLLMAHPESSARFAYHCAFQREGWPFGALHPDAPPCIGDIWHRRFSALIDLFGAQHVANSIAATFLTPWCSVAFTEGLRLPSRPRMLRLAATAAERDALMLPFRYPALWDEHQEIAALQPTRRFIPRSPGATELTAANLGDAAWTALCKRIEIHAWI